MWFVKFLGDLSGVSWFDEVYAKDKTTAVATAAGIARNFFEDEEFHLAQICFIG